MEKQVRLLNCFNWGTSNTLKKKDSVLPLHWNYSENKKTWSSSDSDVDGVNEVLVEDPAIVCHSELSAAETSCLGRAEVHQGWRDYGGWAGGEAEVLPSATPSTLLHTPSSASWADVGKCVRNSNVFLQEASFWAKHCIFNSDRKWDETFPPQSFFHRIRFDVCHM